MMWIRYISKALDDLCLFLLILFLMLGAYLLYENASINAEGDNENYELYEPKDELSFEKLVQLNPDVIGWLKVDNTKIDYPVVQADDNEKYLNMNSLLEPSNAGSVFLDYRNSADFSDFCNIIYGHHMADSAMFGDLSKFNNENFFNRNYRGTLYYNGENHTLQFFAFLEISAGDMKIYNPTVPRGTEGKNYVTALQAKAKFIRPVTIRSRSTLVLLSTCTSNITNGRHVLAGVIVE